MIYDLGKSRAVYSVMWKDVRALVGEISLKDCYRHPAEKHDLKQRSDEAANAYREWVSPILDLSGFPYTYPVNGITHAIDQWLLAETREIQSFYGEYVWPSLIKKNAKIGDPSQIDPSRVLYFSNPFSATGNFDPRWPRILHSGCPVILDCAFIGLTCPQPIPLTERVERVFLSLSKTFGLNSFRAGYMFCREPDPLMDQLMGVGYFHSLIPEIVSTVLNRFSLTEKWELMRPHQERICADLDLVPSDSYLLGLTMKEEYDFWKREDNHHNRVCLTPAFYQSGSLNTLYNPNNLF